MVSSIWSIRGIPRVVTLRTWVSPRSKRPEPCAVGRRPTSAESGRMSVMPLPSTRTPSSTMRLRTVRLVRARTAALISFWRPSKLWSWEVSWASAATTAALRSALPTMLEAWVTSSVPASLTAAQMSSP